MYKRTAAVLFVFLGLTTAVIMKTYSVVTDDRFINAGQDRWSYSVEAGTVHGNIYDCNFKPLTNTEFEYTAVINPTKEACETVLPYVTDLKDFLEKSAAAASDGSDGNPAAAKPFAFKVSKPNISSSDIAVFRTPVRFSPIARHVVGYVQDGHGVTGLESSYDDLLRGTEHTNSVRFMMTGDGTVLQGKKTEITRAVPVRSGVVTTVDTKMQTVCENAAKDIRKGAVLVMDVKTGDIKAMVSKPDYDIKNLEQSLNDEDSPLININLYSYNVGSVFKLLIASQAIEQGISEGMQYECTGSIQIGSQEFKCHDLNGHAQQDMQTAIINSCNTYFINLSHYLDTQNLHLSATVAGFGRPNVLADGIIGSKGNLPSVAELNVPAEKSNFAFGQGKLMATPLQITRFTCAVANDGKLPVPRLVRGITDDGLTVKDEEEPVYSQAMRKSTALKLQDFMIAAVGANPQSKAKDETARCGAKTSTAETGRTDENGEEICHAWITGFFPITNPRYAVTVLVEEGGYGNTAAAPIFKAIADSYVN